MKISDVKYKWSKLFAAKNFGGKDCILAPIEQQELLDDLDTAAAEIEALIDEKMMGFAEWLGNNAYRSAYFRDKWETKDKDNLSTSELLTIFKQQTK